MAIETTKKECILVGAAKIFSRFGFKKTSIDEIAREAGVAKGTVYLAAESKEDLFYQVLHREVRAWTAECAKAIDHRKRADELLTELMAKGMEFLEARPLVRELFFGQTAQSMPDWVDRFEDLRAIGRANLCEVLRLGVKQKVFRQDLDVDTVALLLQDFHLAGQLFSMRRKETHATLAHRAGVALDLVLDGLRTR